MLFLAQTDTTIGFLSKDREKINQAKQRDNQKTLLEVSSLKCLKDFVRVPQKHKNLIRRSSKTTFIYPNGKAIRVIKDPLHLRFLTPFQWLYSSSANLTKEQYNPSFAFEKAEVVIQDKRGLFQAQASKILRLNRHTQKRIR